MITEDGRPVDVIGHNARTGPADRIGGLESPRRMIVTRHTGGHDELVGGAGIEGHAHNRVTPQ